MTQQFCVLQSILVLTTVDLIKKYYVSGSELPEFGCLAKAFLKLSGFGEINNKKATYTHQYTQYKSQQFNLKLDNRNTHKLAATEHEAENETSFID